MCVKCTDLSVLWDGHCYHSSNWPMYSSKNFHWFRAAKGKIDTFDEFAQKTNYNLMVWYYMFICHTSTINTVWSWKLIGLWMMTTWIRIVSADIYTCFFSVFVLIPLVFVNANAAAVATTSNNDEIGTIITLKWIPYAVCDIDLVLFSFFFSFSFFFACEWIVRIVLRSIFLNQTKSKTDNVFILQWIYWRETQSSPDSESERDGKRKRS